MSPFRSSLLNVRPTLITSVIALTTMLTTAWWAKAQVDSALVVPRLIPYEGFLEQEGSPLVNGHDLSFDLYAAEQGGASLWHEAHAQVPIVDGHFAVVLGQATAFPLSVINSPGLYLEVAVDGLPLTGRQQFLSPASGFATGHGVPPGSVMAFAGPQPPPGWLLCNGQALSRTGYPALFEAIGQVHGAGDGSDTFNLPDYRGRFLRGVDQGAGRDPNAASRSANAPGGTSGDGVGSVQDDSTALPNAGLVALEGGSHAHAYADNSGWSCEVTPHDHDVTCDESGVRSDLSRTTDVGGSHFHNVSGGDAETRPTNAAVYWIIKY